MKKHKISSALAGIILFSLIFANMGNADDGDNWIWYGKTDMGDSYYDKSSILNVSPGIIRVLNKDKYSEVGKEIIIQSRKTNDLSIEGYEKLDYVLDHLELDCKNRTIQDIGFLEYDNENKILYAFEYPAPKTIPIPPGTTTETLLRTVCP